MTTFRSLADIYDNEWEITAWKGDADKDTQRVVVLLRRKEPRGKSASEIYHEGVKP